MKTVINSVFITLIFSSLLCSTGFSQIPTTCFEIESILVDACSSNGQEGNNEMVRFRIGPNDMDADDLNVVWPTTASSWNGIVQNGTTASLVEELNATVENCGILIEPLNGILLAGSKVLLTTSYLMSPSENSFENLSDTLYIIFHDANTGNFGNFGNWSSTGVKTLTMTFVGGGGCTDEIQYVRNQLLDQNNITQAGDGASVDYDWDGNSTYYNNGCSAPISPFGISMEVDNNSICPGENLEVTAQTLNGTTLVTWQSEFGVFTQQNSLTSTYESASTNASPFYLVASIENNCGTLVSDSILININPVPNISVSPENASICGTETVTLTVSNGNNYTWNTGETTTSIEVGTTGTYYAIDNSCGSDTAYAEIVAGGVEPVASIDGVLSFCEGDSTTLTASGGETYLWSTDEISESIVIHSAGTISLTVTDNCGSNTTEVETIITEAPSAIIEGNNILCIGSTQSLTATGGSTFEWNTNETTATISINTGGIYTVSVSNGECQTEESIEITTQIPNLNLGEDIESCTFDFTLNPSGFDTYIWQDNSTNQTFNVTTPGTYSVAIVDEFGCVAEDEINFTVGSLPLDLGADFAICSNESVILTAPDEVDANYLWQDGSTSSTFTVNSTGDYSLDIIQGFCQANDMIHIESYQPNAFFELDLTTGCSPLPINISDVSTTSQGEISSWNWGLGNGESLNTQNLNYTYNSIGLHSISLEVITSDGCVDAYSVSNVIEVFSSPNADFSFTQEQTDQGLFVQFTDQTELTDYWIWDFGNSGTAIIQNPSVLYPTSGNYLVTLEVGLQNGCKDEITKEIIFEPEHFIFIPTAITPDNDGINDFFRPVISGGTILDYQFSIYNSWGILIFQTNNQDEYWLGGNNNEKYFTQNNSYNWIVKVLFEGESEKIIKKGVVNIIR